MGGKLVLHDDSGAGTTKNRSKKGWFTGFAIIALIGLSTIATADSRRAFVPMGAVDSLSPPIPWAAISPVDGSLLITSRAEAKLWVLDPGSLEIIDDVSLDGIGHQISLEAY
jgi:hypothetical protein